jgi:hypothetical protein
MSEREPNHIDGPLAEFTALRAEILQGFQMQWNSFALQLTATAVIFSFSLSNTSRTGFLLILPVITYALSSHYLGHYVGMHKITTYIMEELSPKIPGGLRWEEWQRQYAFSRGGPVGRLSTYVSFPWIFPMVSMAAIIWSTPYILYNSHLSGLNRGFLIVIWILDFAITTRAIYSIKLVQKHYNETVTRVAAAAITSESGPIES